MQSDYFYFTYDESMRSQGMPWPSKRGTHAYHFPTPSSTGMEYRYGVPVDSPGVLSARPNAKRTFHGTQRTLPAPERHNGAPRKSSNNRAGKGSYPKSH